MTVRDRLILLATGIVAVAIPAWLLSGTPAPVTAAQAPPAMAAPNQPTPLRAAFARTLFAPPPAEAAADVAQGVQATIERALRAAGLMR